ncbi:MAG: hypothetical protein HOD63_07605 [Bacteroidetes bacterium]|jgi:hypothetical protein|nr:hypothetical protein [Bacteroidota bacterium]MBT5989402.1 hypothetical protein [Bacteroidota bacterium]MBT6836480.1 hypothetical protein [Bacteroidota bacterium]
MKHSISLKQEDVIYLNKFLPLYHYGYYVNIMGTTASTSTYWSEVNSWRRKLKDYFLEFDINIFYLSVIMSEIQFEHEFFLAPLLERKNYIPQKLAGANHLLKLVNSSEDMMEEILQIDIIYKNLNKPKQSIKGKLTIEEIINSLALNQTKFERLAKREERYNKNKQDYWPVKSQYSDFTEMKEELAKNLYRFLQDQLPDRKQYNKQHIQFIGGFLFYSLGLIKDSGTTYSIINQDQAVKYFTQNFNILLFRHTDKKDN